MALLGSKEQEPEKGYTLTPSGQILLPSRESSSGSSGSSQDDSWILDLIEGMGDQEIRDWIKRLVFAHHWPSESQAIMASDLIDEMDGVPPMEIGGRSQVTRVVTGGQMHWEVN